MNRMQQNTIGSLILATLAATALLTVGRAQPSGSQKLQYDVTFSPFHLVDVGAKGPGLGDQVVFNDALAQRGKAVGHEAGFCVITRFDPKHTPALENVCSLTLEVPGGKIVAQGMASEAPKKEIVIIGGTGAFVGARGTATLLEFGNGKGSMTLEIGR
jgi:Dirigent-like protein